MRENEEKRSEKEAEKALKEWGFKEPAICDVNDFKDAFAGQAGQVYDFCMNDKRYKDEYDKSDNKEKFEDVIKGFINYLFDNSANLRVPFVYVRNGDKSLQLLDMEEAYKMYVAYVNKDEKELKRLDEGNQVGKKIREIKKREDEIQKMKDNALDVKEVDTLKYHIAYLSEELIKKANIKEGVIFKIQEGALYDDNNNYIYVKGDIELVYIGQEKKMAITRAFFEKVLEITKEKKNNIE